MRWGQKRCSQLNSARPSDIWYKLGTASLSKNLTKVAQSISLIQHRRRKILIPTQNVMNHRWNPPDFDIFDFEAQTSDNGKIFRHNHKKREKARTASATPTPTPTPHSLFGVTLASLFLSCDISSRISRIHNTTQSSEQPQHLCVLKACFRTL